MAFGISSNNLVTEARERGIVPSLSAEDHNLEALARCAMLANALAKRLERTPDRVLAYRIKCVALSDLILRGWATPNGIDPNGIVGIDIECYHESRLHVPIIYLDSDAQAVIQKGGGSRRGNLTNPEKGHEL